MGDKDAMAKVNNRRFIHPEKCLNEYEENEKKEEEKKKYIQKEREARHKLILKIAEIYELESYKLIPSNFHPYIEDMRNDSTLFGKLGKKYKQGIPYSGIEYTYEYCREKIHYAKKTKTFRTFMDELKYGLAIVRNNLVDAKKYSVLKRREDALREESTTKDMSLSPQVSYKEIQKTKKDELDISDML